ncbi:hypothetical protein NX059_011101 [Plenodomus lindquistii]|nr:hypothetical protein NX059_011101 [Plenodomus lindquistii]
MRVLHQQAANDMAIMWTGAYGRAAQELVDPMRLETGAPASRSRRTLALWRMIVNDDADKAAGTTSRYPNKVRNYLAWVCHILCEHVISVKSLNAAQAVYTSELSIRQSCKKLPTHQKDAYTGIRSLHMALGFDNAEQWGTWHDVPIIRTHLQTSGRKRRQGDVIVEGCTTAALLFSAEDLGL